MEIDKDIECFITINCIMNTINDIWAQVVIQIPNKIKDRLKNLNPFSNKSFVTLNS